MLEAAAVGVPDEVKGEALWVFVVPRPGVDADDALRDELRARVAEHLGPSFRPAAVRFTDALPEDAQRQGAAPRDPRGRRPAPRPATCPGSRTRLRSTAIAAAR